MMESIILPESPLLETRELWWNIHGSYSKVIFYAMAIIGTGIFCFGIWQKLQLILKAKKLTNDNRFENLGQRLKSLIQNAFAQKRLRKNKLAAVAHALVFYGFISLWIVTDIVAMQDHDFFGVYFFQGTFYKALSLFADLAGLAVLVGVTIFLLRRYIFTSKRLDNTQMDWIQPVFLGVFVITGFVIEGFRMAATENIEPFAPIGAGVATFVQYMTVEDLSSAHRFLWWFHSFQTFAFIALIPYTKFMHIFTAPLSIFFYSERKRGQLSTPFNLLEVMEAEAEGKEIDESVFEIGVNNYKDFSWKSVLDSEACTACGSCHVVCPANNTDKPLSPKFLMLDIKKAAKNDHEGDIYAQIHEDVLWSCTTCNACVEECPIMIEHVDTIVDMRRGLLHQNKVPANLQATLKNLRTKSNPWGLAPTEREKWIHEIKEQENLDIKIAKTNKDFEYLYWVGSPGAYDSRNIEVTKANAKLFTQAGLNFAVLGNEEKSSGDLARRAGDEGLFQEIAIENIETLMRYGVKKIITQCPHAFNTLKNEYPSLGLEGVEVYHHTEILANLIQEGKLSPSKEIKETVTYHDPCYLGRYNDIIDPPRYILEQIPGLEIKHIKNEKRQSTCCGGGGSQMWYEMPGNQINSMRLEELNEHSPDKVSVACPYCSIMINTATKNVFPGTNIPEIEDVAITLAKSV